jgi:hypothetical protein
VPSGKPEGATEGVRVEAGFVGVSESVIELACVLVGWESPFVAEAELLFNMSAVESPRKQIRWI